MSQERDKLRQQVRALKAAVSAAADKQQQQLDAALHAQKTELEAARLDGLQRLRQLCSEVRALSQLVFLLPDIKILSTILVVARPVLAARRLCFPCENPEFVFAGLSGK